MDYNLFKVVGAVAGIGGVALASVVYIFREIIRKEIFPQLTKDQGYMLLNRIVSLIFVVGLLGVIAYVVVSVRHERSPNDNGSKEPTPSPTALVSTSIQMPSPGSTTLNNIRNTPTPSPSPDNVNTAGIVAQPTPPPITSEVSGIVCDENGIGLQGAKVIIDELRNVLGANTSGDGQFDLKNIPKAPGESIRLIFTLEGYETYTRDVVIGAPQRKITLRKKTE